MQLWQKAHLVIHAHNCLHIASQDAITLSLSIDLHCQVGNVEPHTLPEVDLDSMVVSATGSNRCTV